MAIITLTTDLGLKDYYVSAIKGAIIKDCSHATIIDITHAIPKFDTEVASFVLKNNYKNFPEGSIHIIDVNTGFSERTPYLIVFANNHYFIASDNGIFSLILDQIKPDAIISIEENEQFNKSIFPARDIFAKAACHIANQGIIPDLGKEQTNFREKINLIAYADANSIKGMVVYIDSYGNAITNISKELFKKAYLNRKFGIQLKPSIKYSSEFGSFEIEEINQTYDDVADGEVVAIFNSTGHLEIAINKGNASGLLGLKNREIIRINFYDNENS